MPNIAGVNPLVENNYVAPRPDIFNQHTWTMRFDHRISDQDQVYVRLGLGQSFRSRSGKTDPMYGYYGSSTVFITLDNGKVQETAFGALHPLRNQFIRSTNNWNCDAAMFKNFPVTERVNFRLQFDFFNVFNAPGFTSQPGSENTGFAQAWQSFNAPRTLQLSGRLSW